ncbi:hypothetical protein SDC9_116018 [bioreactor metagenome]|uniref:Uncharacterized protein n=1 Tax=bioreactor metagenome TaxID=1076179 RepID=A0A645C546_9ZZZZ
MKLTIDESLVCPKCNSSHFEMKREATYVYTYEVNPPDMVSDIKETKETPYLFDNREQINEKEYLICKDCGSIYPCCINRNHNKISLTILQKALRADHQEKPEFWG